MKKFILVMMCLVCVSVCTMAQDTKKTEEYIMPTYGVTLDRKCSVATIEGEKYFNVTIELEAADLGERPKGVKVTVKDENGKEIYNKRFEKSYLYYSSSIDTLQVGKGDILTQVVITKVSDTEVWVASIREKGIY